MVCSDGILAPVRRLAWQALAAGALWIAFAGHAATTPAVPAPPPRFDWSGPADAMAAAALGPLRGAAEVGVWHDGQTRFGAARNRVAESPIQALFEVGSISKVFTGLLLAQAVERGDMALDDTLGGLLNGSSALAPALPAPVAAITLRQLVTHTSCLPRLPADFRHNSDPANPYLRYDRPRLWQALADARLTQSPPCAGAYSNLGFAVLGELLAPHAHRYVCIDSSQRVVAAASERLRRFANVEVREGDMHALPFPDGYFDLVVLMHALTYEGMPPLLTESSTPQAIFFWLMGRSFEVLTVWWLATRVAMSTKSSGSASSIASTDT